MCGGAYSDINTGMQVGCESGILDAYLIGAYYKVSRTEEPLGIAINHASLVCFDLPQSNFRAGDSPAGGITDGSLQRSTRLQRLGR